MSDDIFGFERRDRCPVCGATSTEAFTELPFDSGEIARYLDGFYGGQLNVARLAAASFEVVGCQSCGLVFQRNILDAAGLDELYSNAAKGSLSGTQQRRGLAERRLYSYQIEQAINFFGVPPSRLDVLDFGSGWGLWLDMAAAYGCQTSGVEIGDLPGSGEARRHPLLLLEDLEPSSFHFINSEQVFEHLADPATTVGHLADALRPGGILRISVPNGGEIRERLSSPDWTAPKGSAGSLNAIAPLEHINCFGHDSLVTLGTEVAGLDLFRYPMRQAFDRFERLRFIIDGVAQRVRPRRGTALYFQRRPKR